MGDSARWLAGRSEQEIVRFEKLRALREGGFSFPNDVTNVVSAAVVLGHEPTTPPEQGQVFTVAGRLVALRHMGKASFAHILDGSGKLQLYIRRDDIGEESFNAWKSFDLGDIVEAKGFLFITKTGEKSLHVMALRLLVKALQPLPEKWHGLTDVETRYRHRYVDLISNPEVRELFRKRSQIVREVRRFLDEHGFLEVETPVLEYIQGGTTAKPFRTHFNALDADMVLRIALELPLKKLVVGGFERVYCLGTVFRNEGLSKKHNPEFTMLEFYQAYATFEDLMAFSEKLLTTVVSRICGSLRIPYGEHEIDFTPPYPRISMERSLIEIGGIAAGTDLSSPEALQRIASQHRVHLDEPNDWGRSLEALWGALVEPKLIQPTFITHHPASISPLARRNSADPRVTDRFELFVAGMETGNAFSELNDAIDQRERFEAQMARRASGDEEACELDEDFLRALEYGMPPTAGQGIGIDRLVMLLTNSPTIREVILFPHLKRESEG